jgi:hypothetical protein
MDVSGRSAHLQQQSTDRFMQLCDKVQSRPYSLMVSRDIVWQQAYFLCNERAGKKSPAIFCTFALIVFSSILRERES